MVLGIGALASLGLALPTGLAFGYGYGYGVRQGYSAFKPPSKTADGLKMSANPVTGALGAGLQSAEERTGYKTPIGTLTDEPSLVHEAQKTVSATASNQTLDRDIISSKSGKYSITRAQKDTMNREEFRAWYNEESQVPSRQTYMPRKLTRSSKYKYTY